MENDNTKNGKKKKEGKKDKVLSRTRARHLQLDATTP